MELGLAPTLEDDLVTTLQKMYEDEDNWIPWWLYETDFGTQNTEITTSDGARYVIGTSEDLYKILNGKWDELESCPV